MYSNGYIFVFEYAWVNNIGGAYEISWISICSRDISSNSPTSVLVVAIGISGAENFLYEAGTCSIDLGIVENIPVYNLWNFLFISTEVQRYY